jgi:hypothetical protein
MQNLKIVHNYGFFSDCSIRLHGIIEYFNSERTLPDDVDTTDMFGWYKLTLSQNDSVIETQTNKELIQDITFEYFTHYSEYENINNTNMIDYVESYQYANYSKLKYDDIVPFIKKYFSPSIEIQNIITNIEKKYSLSIEQTSESIVRLSKELDYNNICVLYYRGNDKNTETQICGYDEYVLLAQDMLKKHPDICFLIQSDETEFIEEMTLLFPNSFYFKEEIRHMPRQLTTVDMVMRENIDIFSKNYLAITIIMSKCKYIICGSGNCSIWIMLYRGNSNNVYQNINGKWILNE